MSTTRRLDWEALLNARDVGGYPTTDGRELRWGALIRSDSLSSLTPAGRDALVAYGVRTIVDLRMPLELLDAPNPFAEPGDHGIAYRNVSFIDPAIEPPATHAPTLAEDYVGMLDRFAPQVSTVVGTIAGAEPGGVLVHCAAGKDRTGLVVAMVLAAVGVAPEVIAEDYGLTAESLRSREQRWLEEGPGSRAERVTVLERVRARPEVMLEVLAQVDARYGGVDGYLVGIGVAKEDMGRLRQRLVAPSDGSEA